jgi:transcriptional regulator with XRE-family HTH domain
MLKMGGVLKKARVERSMTLADLSARCGYSKALISRIENNNVSPSIESLTKISEALDLKLYDIFAAVEVYEPAIVREKDRERFSAAEGTAGIEFLTTGSSSKLMQPLLLSLEAGAESSERVNAHGGEEFFLVLKGMVEVYVGDYRYVLKTGDSVCYKATVPHGARNVSSKRSSALVIMSPPYF